MLMLESTRLMAFALVLFISTVGAGPAVLAPFEIPVVLPLTGSGAFMGQTQQKTLQLAESVVNKDGGIKGRPIHFAFYDDQASPQTSVELTTQLLTKKPPIVMGSSLAAMCRAQMPLFSKGPVQYCLSPAIYPAAGSFTFAASVNSKDSIAAGIRYLRARGWRRIALLATTDASGQDGTTAINEAMVLPENRDMKLVTTQQFAPNDVSIGAQVANIKAATPDAIYVWMAGTPFGTALRGLSDAGVTIPVIASSANMIDSQLRQYQAFIPKQLYFSALSFAAGVGATPGIRQAQRVYLDALVQAGMHNDLQTGLAWDPAMIVVDALRHVGAATDGEQIRNYLSGLHGFAGITGVYDFRNGNQHGVGSDAITIIRWDGDKDVFSAASRPGGASPL
jgi:branched-chain amino acid transport system substrate-binding protein